MVINHQQLFEWLPIIKRAKIQHCRVISKFLVSFLPIPLDLTPEIAKMQCGCEECHKKNSRSRCLGCRMFRLFF